MIGDIKGIIEKAKSIGPVTISVAVADDDDVLNAVEYAREENIANSILVGDEDRIREILHELSINPEYYEIVDVKDKAEACKVAVNLIKENRASILMKDFVDTSVIMRAVLNKETGLPHSGLLSHIGVFKIDKIDRLIYLTDSAVNIYPSLEDKVKIINNAVKVAHALGNEMPKVGCVTLLEKVNEKIQSNVDAKKLSELNEQGVIKGCIVGSQFAMDNAISKEAALHKKVTHPGAGEADILLLNSLDVANVLNKTLEYLAHSEVPGVIMGSSAPVVMTSRSSSSHTKLNSIALSTVVANHREEE